MIEPSEPTTATAQAEDEILDRPTGADRPFCGPSPHWCHAPHAGPTAEPLATLVERQ